MAVIVAISEADMAADRRRAPRHRLCLDVEAAMPGQSASSAVIHDLSATGFLIETPEPIVVGELLEVQLPEKGKVPARVVWGCGSHFGCEFERPLPPAILSAATLKAKPAADEALLPPGLRLERPSQSEQRSADGAVPARRGTLPFIVVLSVAVWAAIAIALVYTAT